MKFDVCIGNPPYQETKSGTRNVSIWPNFIKETSNISDKRCFIHPGRWVIPKKNDKALVKDLIDIQHLTRFKFWSNADKCFNGIALDGGISITYFNSEHTGMPEYYIDDKYMGTYTFDTIIFANDYLKEAYTKIFDKIVSHTKTMLDYRYGVSTVGCTYGVDKKINGDKLKDSPVNMKEPIKVWINTDMRNSQGEYEWKYIEKNDMLSYPDYLFNSRKVMITNHGNAIHGGNGNVINNNPQICDKFSTAVGVYWFYPAHDTDRELELIKSLFMTKTARYLMSIKQRDRCCMGFECIPDYIELAKLLPEDELFTDEWFYKTFDFSEGLINEIETRVSPKIEK